MEIPFPCCLTWLHWMHLGIKQQNKTALYDQTHRGAISFFMSCCASCYRVLNVPTQHLKAEGSLFCLWFKLAGREPDPIWRQRKLFSSKWCQTLVNTMLLCLRVLFFPLGFLGSLELLRCDLFCSTWHNCTLYHICLFFSLASGELRFCLETLKLFTFSLLLTC